MRVQSKLIFITVFLAGGLFKIEMASADNRQYVTPDFFIQVVENKKGPFIFSTDGSEKTKDCKAKLNQIICLVDPAKKGEEQEDRKCLAGGSMYSHFFETLYDSYPHLLQKMFCSLNVIFIEKEFFGTAYAGLIKDKNENILGAQMGIRKSVLDENLNLETWASWKEQLSFGGIAGSYTVSSYLPKVDTAPKETNVNDFLYFVVAHEFGHIFDFTNNINKTKNCSKVPDNQEPPECDLDESSWGGISWISDKRPKPENDFLNRSLLCFYWCNGSPLDPENVPQLYSDLSKTDFISIYATTQPWDDFADSLAYFLLNQNLRSKYEIDTKKGFRYDIIKKINSTLWKKKYQFLSEFLKRTDIIFPHSKKPIN